MNLNSTLSFRRSDRVARLLQESIAELLIKEVQDPELRSVTVTAVELDESMRVATVKVCKMMEGAYKEPSPETQKKVLKALERADAFLFARLRKTLKIRRLPHIQYRYDRALPEASRVWSKMNEWSRQTQGETRQ